MGKVLSLNVCGTINGWVRYHRCSLDLSLLSWYSILIASGYDSIVGLVKYRH